MENSIRSAAQVFLVDGPSVRYSGSLPVQMTIQLGVATHRLNRLYVLSDRSRRGHSLVTVIGAWRAACS